MIQAVAQALLLEGGFIWFLGLTLSGVLCIKQPHYQELQISSTKHLERLLSFHETRSESKEFLRSANDGCYSNSIYWHGSHAPLGMIPHPEAGGISVSVEKKQMRSFYGLGPRKYMREKEEKGWPTTDMWRGR